MNDAVLVRSSMRSWDFSLLLVVAVVLLVGAGVTIAVGNGLLAIALAALAGACGLVGVVGRQRRVRRRLWVRDTGDGFVISDHEGDRQIDDDQVLSMAIDFKENYFRGVLKSRTRRFMVWLPTEGERPERLEMTNKIPPSSADPLAGLIGRLGTRLLKQAEGDMQAGRPVLGECWTLEGGQLKVRQADGTIACRIEDVAAVDEVDSQVCIWRAGVAAPLARVPAKSANAYLLYRLLLDRLAQRPTTATVPAEESLGRRNPESRYEDVEAFTYSAERHFQHGAYTGTLFDLTFDPVAERKADRIRYMITLKNADSELERLRDQVSRMIAGRMAQRLAAKRPVDWTPRLHLLPDGIEYRWTRFLGRKESVVVPFGEIETFTVDERVFRLWVKGRGKPVIRESTRARISLPGSTCSCPWSTRSRPVSSSLQEGRHCQCVFA
jgi:hypothetical protein